MRYLKNIPFFKLRCTCPVLLPCFSAFQVNGTFPIHTSRSDGNLTINSLTKIDDGVYECIAKDRYTSIIASTLVIIESKYIALG